MAKKKYKRQNKSMEVIKVFTKDSKSFDPQGSYTGKGIAENEKPVQDADDL